VSITSGYLHVVLDDKSVVGNLFDSDQVINQTLVCGNGCFGA
jgi:hypothetical protein